jgi:prophage regulatory protein
VPTTTPQRRVVAIGSAEYHKQPQTYLTAPEVTHDLFTGARKKLLRLPQVKESTGLSRTSIYRKIASHEFPRPVRLGPKSVAWIEGEIQQWMSGLVLSRDREIAA